MAQPPSPRVTSAQIAQMARARGYDPRAVLAVGSREGLSGGIGDAGHAYGPFQLNNAGGVITGTHPGTNDPRIQEWAWSPEGVAFALDRMGAARGQTGRQAINSIVTQFERPANPQAEIAGALAAYGSTGSGGAGAVPSPAAPPAAPAAAGQPPPDRQALMQALLGASRSGDYSGFFGAVQASRQAPAAPQSQVATPTMTSPTGGYGGAPGRVLGATQGEQPAFLQALAALAGYTGKPISINSGYRSRERQAALYANRASNPNPVAPPGQSLHEQGLAADGTIGGAPIGTLPPALLARFGLESVPGDPVHVQVRR